MHYTPLMPRYFFNFDNDSAAVADLVGRELPDDEAAKQEAARLAADLGVLHAINGEHPAYDWIEVLDETHRTVVRLPVSAALKEPNRTR